MIVLAVGGESRTQRESYEIGRAVLELAEGRTRLGEKVIGRLGLRDATIGPGYAARRE